MPSSACKKEIRHLLLNSGQVAAPVKTPIPFGRVVNPGTLCFFNDTATTEIYTLSLHDALPISPFSKLRTDLEASRNDGSNVSPVSLNFQKKDRKSTRLNSSHVAISYAVFC